MIRHRSFQHALLTSLFLLLSATGCGYHTTGKAVRLPENVRSIYVPTFTNNTQAFRVEQVLTAALVQELRSRTNFQVVLSNTGSADATFNGTVSSASTFPLTYDSQTGKTSSSMLLLVLKLTLVDKSGKVLWSNPSYYFKDQYELSQDAASFFEEESPALNRIAHDFAKEVVADIVEAY